MFSSRVPKRLSTPRLIRTLAFIEWVLNTSKPVKTATGWDGETGMVRSFVNPLARAAEHHLLLLYRRVKGGGGSALLIH
jgi:hypothetical protein